jgi:hypothetical protein
MAVVNFGNAPQNLLALTANVIGADDTDSIAAIGFADSDSLDDRHVVIKTLKAADSIKLTVRLKFQGKEHPMAHLTINRTTGRVEVDIVDPTFPRETTMCLKVSRVNYNRRPSNG